MDSVFKVGDKVFSINCGWGKVTNIAQGKTFPILVNYDNGKQGLYTNDGRADVNDDFKLLSFTEYDLVNGGFSQVRQIPKDTLVFVRHFESQPWEIRYFSHFVIGQVAAFKKQLKSTDTSQTQIWNYYSFENPLEK